MPLRCEWEAECGSCPKLPTWTKPTPLSLAHSFKPRSMAMILLSNSEPGRAIRGGSFTSSSWHSGSYVCPPSVQECQIRNLVPATRLFGRIILRQLIDLWRQRALIEQDAFKAFDVLRALGQLLPMLFEV